MSKLGAAALALGLVSTAAAAQAQRHTLVIAMTTGGITQIDFPTARACFAAAAAIREQLSRQSETVAGGLSITPLPPVMFCVPR